MKKTYALIQLLEKMKRDADMQALIEVQP